MRLRMPLRMQRYLLTFLTASSPAWAQSPGPGQGQGMKPEDIHRLHSVRDVRVSSDGQSILYTESDSSGPRRATSQLFIYDRRSGSSRVFRNSGWNSGWSSGEGGFHARWSPDGTKVALLGAHQGRFGLVVTGVVPARSSDMCPLGEAAARCAVVLRNWMELGR